MENLNILYKQLDEIFELKVNDGTIKYTTLRVIKKILRENQRYDLSNLLSKYLENKNIKIIYPNDFEERQNGLEENITNPSRMYEIEIEYTKMKTQNEINELVKRRNAGDVSARNEIVEANLRLVRKVASYYKNSDLPYEDILQEGNIGLIRAAEKYEIDYGKFSSYAVNWIRGKIIQALKEKSKIIKIPTDINNLSRKVKRLIEDEEIIKYSISDLAYYFNQSEENITRALKIADDPIMFSSLNINNDDQHLEMNLEDSNARIFVHNIEVREELKSILEGKLSEREKIIIYMKYGLHDGIIYSCEEIGKVLGISRKYVNLIKLQTIERIGIPIRIKNKREIYSNREVR